MLMSMTAWLQRLRQIKHFCPRCGGMLQVALTSIESGHERSAVLEVLCPGCNASLRLTAEEVEEAATAQLLVHVGLRPQRLCGVGVHHGQLTGAEVKA